MTKRTVMVTSRSWQRVGRVRHMNADHRLDIDIDEAGIGWARIVRGGDEAVPVEVGE